MRDVGIGLAGLAVVLQQDESLRVLEVEDQVVDGFVSVLFYDDSVREVLVGDAPPEIAGEVVSYLCRELGRMDAPVLQ
jgi:hypothetical protein